MTTDTADSGRFDIGRVIQQTFAVLGRNIVTFSLLGLLLAGLPRAIAAFAQAAMMRNANPFADGSFNFSMGYFQGAGLGGLAAVITTAILQGTLIYATVQDLGGQRASIGDCLANGLRNFLPLLGVTILSAIAIFFGFLLLVVPGVMLACAWCVAVPAVVADRTGVFGAFERSAQLTRGNRWQIFGLGVIVVVALMIVSTILNLITGVSAYAGDPSQMFERMLSPVFLVVTVLRSTVGSVIGATAIAVIYVELRRVQEGAGPEWLRDVFA
jgi:hypothetical protein